MSKKLIGYAILGLAGIVGLYWFYKKGMSEGAQTALSGGLSGFGGAARGLIGETLGFEPTMGKQESMNAAQGMKARPSGAPTTQASTVKDPAKLALELQKLSNRNRSTTAKNVQSRTSGVSRDPVPLGRRIPSGSFGARGAVGQGSPATTAKPTQTKAMPTTTATRATGTGMAKGDTSRYNVRGRGRGTRQHYGGRF